MTLLTHAGRSFQRSPHSSARRDRPKAASTSFALVRRFCMFVLAAMLMVSAVGAAIAFKTVAYLSHFTH